ncbi:major facilitator superfamily domain-containing protein [Radiomyces spectabilis]|uniref:major facilitator superfamily domain-containing protein n=1 Tax=Radiomyces spectabilis TaxID=64574 RepID=UPI00221F0C47|nr:major facilitator superfamily domain-containing protein [Radiomyces spectabilis]KAI8377838.1 major facilitator superfamily domain-containing protein [Radiomyces spectabilis]
MISLGLPKELTALVWMLGPITGLIAQPIIGALSDQSTFKWGRRRPFILIASLFCCLALMGVAYTNEIAASLVPNDSRMRQRVAIGTAVASFYMLDFSTGTVQSLCRALVVDVFPLSQQETANVFSTNLSNITTIFGYFTGYIDLVQFFPSIADSQMKVFCIMGTFIFASAVAVTCICVREQPLSLEKEAEKKTKKQTLAYIYHSIRRLPNSIQVLCNVQLFAYLAWFPILFYSTTWVSDVYFQSHAYTRDNWTEGTRAGAFAMLLYASTSVVAGLVLPYLTVNRVVTLKRTLTASLVLLGCTMHATFYIDTVTGTTVVIAIFGIPWACTLWIPFALVGEYMLMEQATTVPDTHAMYGATEPSSRRSSTETEASDHFIDMSTEERPPPESGFILGIVNMYIILPQFLVAIIAAILFCVVPLISSSTKTRLPDPINSDQPPTEASAVIWILQFGAIMAFVASYLCTRLIDVKYKA